MSRLFSGQPLIPQATEVDNSFASISPITSKLSRIYSFEVEIPAQTGGLDLRSKVMINQTRAVYKVRLLKKIGGLPESVMLEVDRALKLHYDLP